MNRLMKNILLLLITAFFCTELYAAEQGGEIILRFSRQDDSTAKIVFEANEPLIKSSNTIATLSQIKVEFAGKFDLKKQTDFPYEIIKHDRIVTMNLKDVLDVRAYKLTDPSRIVIHLKTAAKKPVPLPGHQTTPMMQQEGTRPPAEFKKPHATEQLFEKKQKIAVIALDPGHGGYEFGLVMDQIKEKELNLSIARDLSDSLLKKGYKPFLLRRTDQHLSLLDRIRLANGKKPDLLISVHATSLNSFFITFAAIDDTQGDAAAKLYSLGARQGRHIERSKAFAKILSETIRGTYNSDVTLQELPLPLLTSLDAPAVLIEYPASRVAPYDQKSKERLSDILVRAISAYEQ